jgi:ATP phosphoribosyltransferase
MDNVSAVVGIPSKGRLRDEVIRLLSDAGYPLGSLRGRTALAQLCDGVRLIEMRPKDAAVALASRRLDAAFIASDLVVENDLADYPSIPLGFAKSDLVFACRDEAVWTSLHDFENRIIATHLPRTTECFLRDQGIGATVVDMAGSLEGVCAAGLADAIVDLRETGISLAQNNLKVVELIQTCEAEYVARPDAPAELNSLSERIVAVLSARRSRYVMLHLPRNQLTKLVQVCAGLESPTVLPLAERTDTVAVHVVIEADELWDRLAQLKEIGATSIIAVKPDAVL